jgi:hypothetical protein
MTAKGSHEGELKTVFCTPLIVLLLLSGCGSRETTTDCDIGRGTCVKNIGEGVSASFDITPKPVKTMSERLFSVVLRKGGAPLTGATVTLDLSMPGMYMARNRVSLVHAGEGIYEGKGIIVKCPSGRKVWRARIAIDQAGKNRAVADYTFRVEE